MNKVDRYIGMIILLIPTLCSMGQSLNKSILFPGNKKAAICLTYDDGMYSHLSYAIPQLDQAGFKGTFFINSANGQNNVAGWMHAAKEGHELGNHSIFHPCPAGMGWPKELETDGYTVEKILNEVKVTDGILRLLDPVKSYRTYGYPCNNVFVGGKSYIEPLKKSKLVKYARGGGPQDKAIVLDYQHLDLMHVPSYIVTEDSEADKLIAVAEKVKLSGGLLVFQFHGVGGQWIKVSNETHIAFLNYLKANEKDIWVAPFKEVIQFIDKNR
ncbi:MAG: polysaccharide deacetylase family protein [Saprospiraceae bacterium]